MNDGSAIASTPLPLLDLSNEVNEASTVVGHAHLRPPSELEVLHGLSVAVLVLQYKEHTSCMYVVQRQHLIPVTHYVHVRTHWYC